MRVTSLQRRPAIADESTVERSQPAVSPSLPRLQASVKKVAEILDFSGEKVRQLCRDGEIEYTGDGRGYRIYLDSVAAYQERQTRRRAS